MTWIVELDGDQHSLHELEEAFRGDVSVILLDGKYRLDPVLFVNAADYGEVKAIAQQEVDLFNAYIRVFLPGYQKTALGHISREEPGKPKVKYVSVVEGLAMSARLVGIKLGDEKGVILAPDRGPGLRAWQRLISAEPAVGDVYGYLRGSLSDWSNLGRIMEAVEHDVGDRDSLIATGWVDAQSIRAFHATANNPLVAGTTARHGARKFESPKKPMEIHEARGLVLRVVRRWIEAKAAALE